MFSRRYLRATGSTILSAIGVLLWIGSPRAGQASPPLADAPAVESPTASQSNAGEAITALIHELGSEQFARRERAQAELQRLGLSVFDELTQAQESVDLEIALRVKYLLNRMKIPWVRETDPAEVKRFLQGYDSNLPTDRRSLMDQLGALPDYQGVGALCRLARFESSVLLAKQAALQVLHQPYCHQPDRAVRLAETIRDEIADSRRASAAWLATYAEMLVTPQTTLPSWEDLCAQEEYRFHNSPEASSSDILRDLLRCHADFLQHHQRPEEALEIVLQSMELLSGDEDDLQETMDWLLEREAWDLAHRVADRFPGQFQDNVDLLYQLAETHRKQGDKLTSEEVAARALALHPENLTAHIEAAQRLQERGLLDWSEREYRQVIQHGAPESKEALRARISYLSEMLHDGQREQEAAQTLQEALEIIESNKNVRYLVNNRLHRTVEGIYARMHFFLAEAARLNQDYPQQRAQLELGVKYDDTDVDLLIGMYHLGEADQAWRDNTQELIEKASANLRNELDAYRRLTAESANESERRENRYYLAVTCNQFAWLLANTTGDYEEAVRCSQLSLEILPGRATFLDTLGRCYYAKGDLENAVKYQRQAVSLEPHSGQIRRQLELFEDALSRQVLRQP